METAAEEVEAAEEVDEMGEETCPTEGIFGVVLGDCEDGSVDACVGENVAGADDGGVMTSVRIFFNDGSFLCT